MNKTILIITNEENTDSTKDLQKKLEGYNFNIQKSTNQKESLKILENEKINLVIINKVLEKNKSWKLAQKIKDIDRYLPVVYVTVSEEEKNIDVPEEEAELLDKYTDGVINKPFIHKIIYKKLSKLLRVANRLRDLKKVKDFSIVKIGTAAGLMIIVLTAIFYISITKLSQAPVTEYAKVTLTEVFPSIHIIIFLQCLLFIIALVAGCVLFYRSIDTRVNSIENLVVDILQSR
ncbi:MAG: hypothetical protein ACQEQC_02565 [Elusimicrobiota bacterium]